MCVYWTLWDEILCLYIHTMGIDENNDEMAETDSGVKNGNGTWSDTDNVNTEPWMKRCALAHVCSPLSFLVATWKPHHTTFDAFAYPSIYLSLYYILNSLNCEVNLFFLVEKNLTSMHYFSPSICFYGSLYIEAVVHDEWILNSTKVVCLSSCPILDFLNLLVWNTFFMQ